MPVSEIPKSKVNTLNGEKYQLQLEESVDENSFRILSFEGLPKGNSPASVMRCIRLLEHVVSCDGGGCPDGEGCRRTRQVLSHNLHCTAQLRCNICRQLRALCRNHSDHCQAGERNCAVPYCKNMKIKTLPSTTKPQANSFNKHQSRKEYHYVFKKLSETIVLPNKQQKLQQIESLLETNREATIQFIRYIMGKKQNPYTISLSNQIRSLLTDMKSKEGCPKRNTVFKSPNLTGLKLDVIARKVQIG